MPGIGWAWFRGASDARRRSTAAGRVLWPDAGGLAAWRLWSARSGEGAEPFSCLQWVVSRPPEASVASPKLGQAFGARPGLWYPDALGCRGSIQPGAL